MSAITGRSGDGTNYPHFSPASFWTSKIELVINNVTIDTLYAVSNFVNQQFFFEDEDWLICYIMGSSYASVVERGTLSSTAGTIYYVKLRTFSNECHIFILSDSHNLQTRVYMD